MVAAAVSCGVLAVVALIILRTMRFLGDKVFDYQLYVAMGAAAGYLVVAGGSFEDYVISLALLRFVLLGWDVIDLLKIRLTERRFS